MARAVPGVQGMEYVCRGKGVYIFCICKQQDGSGNKDRVFIGSQCGRSYKD